MKKTKPNSKIEIWGMTYINGFRQADDKNKEIIQIEPTEGKNFIVEVVDKANDTKMQELAEENERLEMRLKHLLSSDVIRQYDEHDRRTGTYARDISKFDKKYNKYKAAYYMLNCPHITPETNNEFEKA